MISPSPQFSSKRVGLFKDFLAENNVTTLQLPPYSPDLAPVPSTEISIERTALLWCYWHTLTVIEYMLCFCNPRGTDWNKWLPFACFVYSITPHTITRYTPYKMLFGRKASVPGQLLQKPTAVYNYDYVVNDVKRKLQECNELTRANLMQTKQNRFTQQTSRV